MKNTEIIGIAGASVAIIAFILAQAKIVSLPQTEKDIISGGGKVNNKKNSFKKYKKIVKQNKTKTKRT